MQDERAILAALDIQNWAEATDDGFNEQVKAIAAVYADVLDENERLKAAIVTPDDLIGDGDFEIVYSGSYECQCGCDPDDNLCFLGEDGLRKVTHLKCRSCGRLKPFWEIGEMLDQANRLESDNAALRQRVAELEADAKRLDWFNNIAFTAYHERDIETRVRRVRCGFPNGTEGHKGHEGNG